MDIKEKITALRGKIANTSQNPASAKEAAVLEEGGKHLSGGSLEAKSTGLTDFFSKGGVKKISGTNDQDNWLTYGVPSQELAEQVRGYIRHPEEEFRGMRRIAQGTTRFFNPQEKSARNVVKDNILAKHMEAMALEGYR